MKTNRFKPTLLFFTMLIPVVFTAQEYKEIILDTNVDKNAKISVEVSDILVEIEEWGKNRVVVETRVQGDDLDAETAQIILKNWNVIIKSAPDKVFVKTHGFKGSPLFFTDDLSIAGTLQAPDVFFFPEPNFKIIDSLPSAPTPIFDIPEVPVPFDFSADTITFDFDKFQTDSTYFKEWQIKNEEKIKKLLDEARKKEELYRKRMEKAQKCMNERNEKFKKMQKKRAGELEKRRSEIIARQKSAQKKREERINLILMKRSAYQKSKSVKKILHIKIPKDSKLIMNVNRCEIKYM